MTGISIIQLSSVIIKRKGDLKMKYQVLFITEVDYGEKKGNVALLFLPSAKLPQYAVVRNIDLGRDDTNDDLWDAGWYFNDNVSGLQGAIDLYRQKTEKDYISRARLEELATLFKDGLIEDDKTEAYIYFNDICEMEPNEKEYFGIDDDENNDDEED